MLLWTLFIIVSVKEQPFKEERKLTTLSIINFAYIVYQLNCVTLEDNIKILNKNKILIPFFYKIIQNLTKHFY